MTSSISRRSVLAGLFSLALGGCEELPPNVLPKSDRREILPPISEALPSFSKKLVQTGAVSPVWGITDFERRDFVTYNSLFPKLRYSNALPPILEQPLWNELCELNRAVNVGTQPVTDIEHWGVADRWDIPKDGKGDCEDYVLLKLKVLGERHPSLRRFLHIGVVIDGQGDGHAVLCLECRDRAGTIGTLVFDNMRDELLSFDATGYRPVKWSNHDGTWQNVTLVESFALEQTAAIPFSNVANTRGSVDVPASPPPPLALRGGNYPKSTPTAK